MTARTLTTALGIGAARPADKARPASTAAAAVSRATVAVGALGIATSLFVVSRVFESWRVGHAHTVSLLGGQLSYPAANAGAIAVLGLALLGASVAATAILAAVNEVRAARRLEAALDRCAVGSPAPSVGSPTPSVGSPTPAGDAVVIESPESHAFCAGLLRPRVFITTAALQRLDDEALAALIAHERHHAQRRDPLRRAAGRVLASSLFFLPWVRALADRERALAELSADESAALRRGRPALARAMLAFEPAGGIDPARVDRLLGEAQPADWRFPTALVAAALAVTALLAAAAALVAQFASGSATLAAPFLSSRPCVIMLALVPAAVAFLGLRAVGRMRGSWPIASSRERFRDPRSDG